ncbi:hypothetical protein BST97_02855 [Nonlabens spongiae]|uniref:LamG-like jellyroll fold domain-containing protein n=1 Tax=Nonlabens spongiae TaxID=331648 RepID=A0A1W6MHE2_9FLAO|nr:LamG-like jellyroll fold domain-containing protein [Nonlabens spongiae]ARN77023.1 hypothetical protein BST97_02855 [Nonlabens spongiae]
MRHFYLYLTLIFSFVSIAQDATHLTFDGVNDHVVLPSESSFDFTSEFTVEFWMRSSTIPQQWDALVAKGDDSWRVALTDAGNIAFAGNGSFSDFFSTVSVTDGNWHHIAAVKTATDAYIYIDGVQNVTASAPGTVNNSGFAVSIGENLQATGRYYTGEIDDIRIWSTSRTSTEIDSNRFCELGGSESNLTAYYKMNNGVAAGDNSDVTVLDNASSNGTALNGILNNFALNGSSSNWISGTAVSYAAISSSTDATCGDNGSATVQTYNMTNPTYLWSNNATTATVSNLATGTYTCVITAQNGCTSSVSVIIDGNDPIAYTITKNNDITCNGDNDGSATVSVTGGTPPYTILWSTSEYGTTLNNLFPGTYYIAGVSDSLGCGIIWDGSQQTITITEPALVGDTTVSSPVTYDQGDTAVPLTATLGSNATTLLWYTAATGGTGSTTAPTPDTSSTGNTSYWVSSANANGCESARVEIVVTVNVSIPDAPTTSYSTQVYTGDDKDLTTLQVTGDNIQWYDAAIGGNLLTNTSLLVDEITYYATQTVNGTESTDRLAITANRISENSQTLPDNSTVADLIATPSSGTTVKWYTNATGGTALAPTDELQFGTYYVEQFSAVATSNRVPVQVDVPFTPATHVHFDGVDDKISLFTSISGQVFTKELWIKPSTLSGIQHLFSYTDGSAGESQHDLWMDNGYIKSGEIFHSATILTSTIQVAVDQWTHIAVISGNLSLNLDSKIYINGVEVASSDSSGAGSNQMSGNQFIGSGGFLLMQTFLEKWMR